MDNTGLLWIPSGCYGCKCVAMDSVGLLYPFWSYISFILFYINFVYKCLALLKSQVVYQNCRKMTTASDAKLREPWWEYCIVVLYLEQVCSLYRHCCIWVSCKNEYLMIDSGAHLCTNILRAPIAAWLYLPREVKMVSDWTVKCTI